MDEATVAAGDASYRRGLAAAAYIIRAAIDECPVRCIRPLGEMAAVIENMVTSAPYQPVAISLDERQTFQRLVAQLEFAVDEQVMLGERGERNDWIAATQRQEAARNRLLAYVEGVRDATPKHATAIPGAWL